MSCLTQNPSVGCALRIWTVPNNTIAIARNARIQSKSRQLRLWMIATINDYELLLVVVSRRLRHSQRSVFASRPEKQENQESPEFPSSQSAASHLADLRVACCGSKRRKRRAPPAPRADRRSRSFQSRRPAQSPV